MWNSSLLCGFFTQWAGVCLWIMVGRMWGKCLVFCGLVGCAGNGYKGHVFCGCFFIGTIINDLMQ